ARYWRGESGGGVQEVAEAAAEVELLVAAAGERERVREWLQSECELSRGGMLRAGLLRTAEGEEERLLLDVHHLVVDGVSWRVLVGDLEVLCGQLQRGEEPRLGAASTSYKRWAELLEARAGEPELLERVEEWVRPEREQAGRLPVELEGGENRAWST